MGAIEKRARNILGCEFNATMKRCSPKMKALDDAAIRAIIVSLTPPEGYVLVPVEPTQRMVNAADDAYMPFGDMEFAIQAAISARPEAK